MFKSLHPPKANSACLLFSIPGLPPEGRTAVESYLPNVQTARFRPVRNRNVCLSLPHTAEGPLSPSRETRNTLLLSPIFHVTGWRAAICLHSEVKHHSVCLCGDLLLPSRRLNACSGYWTWRNRPPNSSQSSCNSTFGLLGARNKRQHQAAAGAFPTLAQHFAVVALFSLFCKHCLTVKCVYAAFWRWLVHLVATSWWQAD